MTAPWSAGRSLFRPSDLRSTTWARGFGRSIAELDPRNGEPLAAFAPVPARPGEGDIIVTGGAGFLGARVIKELLARKDDARIYICSRNPGSIGKTMKALVGAPEAFRLILDERIFILPVDLASDDAVETVAGYTGNRPIRSIIHLAAALDAFASRERLLAANETATRNVIAIAARTGARLVNASTLSVFVSSDMGGEDRETSLRDEPERMLLGGYAQTKAVADMLVEDAAAADVDACSVRLGLLVPERDGLMEKGSFLSSFRDALRDVGVVPTTTEEAAVDLTPVDQAAACLMAMTGTPRVPKFIHYANPRSATLSMVVANVLGTEPTIIEDAEWDRRVGNQQSIQRALLEAAFRKTRFVSTRCTSRPLANADLFQSTARDYDPSTAVDLGAPMPRAPEVVCASLMGRRR